MDKYAEIKNDYDAFLNGILCILPNEDKNTVLKYYVSAILKIWGSNLLYSPDYSALLAAITGKNYTIERILTAMGCCGDPERHLKVPDFFLHLVEHDSRSNGTETSKALTRLNDLLVASAMINGDFTTEEANAVTQIMSELSGSAAFSGITVPDYKDISSLITGKNEASYLQNDALVSAARRKSAPEGIIEQPAQAGPPAVPVTININVTNDDKDAPVTPDSPNNVEHAGTGAVGISKPDAQEKETIDSLLTELDGLVGLDSVKRDVHSLMNFIKVARIREQRGKKVPTVSYHLVFTGNPGTGKTTVARLVARLYYHIGILPQGQLVETDRSALVAGYLGQTAIKTQKVIQQAMGGVLFIDEAYALAGDSEDSYGKEAIETILKAMEDHLGELVVIVAGYTELMHRFIDSNPGLSSRFSKYFEFPD